jgi:hypothetical protein
MTLLSRKTGGFNTRRRRGKGKGQKEKKWEMSSPILEGAT